MKGADGSVLNDSEKLRFIIDNLEVPSVTIRKNGNIHSCYKHETRGTTFLSPILFSMRSQTTMGFSVVGPCVRIDGKQKTFCLLF